MPTLVAFLQAFLDAHPVVALKNCGSFTNCAIVDKDTIMTKSVVLFNADGRGLDFFEHYLRAGFAAMISVPSDRTPSWLPLDEYAAYAFAETEETLFVLKHSVWRSRLEAAMRETGFSF